VRLVAVCTIIRTVVAEHTAQLSQRKRATLCFVRPLLGATTSANVVITIEIRLRSDYDVSRSPAANSTRANMNMSIFRRCRIVVISQSNRTEIVILITSVVVECVVVSSYRSRIVVESQL